MVLASSRFAGKSDNYLRVSTRTLSGSRSEPITIKNRRARRLAFMRFFTMPSEAGQTEVASSLWTPRLFPDR
jgi:hypothetical protein